MSGPKSSKSSKGSKSHHERVRSSDVTKSYMDLVNSNGRFHPGSQEVQRLRKTGKPRRAYTEPCGHSGASRDLKASHKDRANRETSKLRLGEKIGGISELASYVDILQDTRHIGAWVEE